MDWSDVQRGLGGSFLIDGTDDTDALDANVTGAQKRFLRFMALEAASTLSTLHDNGATAFGNGTASTNYGVNYAATDAFPVGQWIYPSTNAGFTRLVVSGGSFLVQRLTNSFQGLN